MRASAARPAVRPLYARVRLAVHFIVDMLAEKPVRALPLVLAVSLAACTTYVLAPTSPTVTRWEGRSISELVTAIGPYDTTSVKGDWRSYDWFRFGNCHLTARTSLEDKIQALEMQGVGTGCNVYLDKLGSS